MTDSTNISTLSVYHGQSDQGIGSSGQGSLPGGGEQYLAADEELHNADILKDIKSWLTLDSEPRDQLRLDELEAWSYFSDSEGKFSFTCRMVLSGKDSTKRRLYFSHARAWEKTNYNRKYYNPGLYIGSDKDFEEPWQNRVESKPIDNLSSMEDLQKEIITTTSDYKNRIEKYLSYFLYGLLMDKTIIISVNIDSFERSSPLHRCISLVQSLMPVLDKSINIRIYTSSSIQTYIQTANLLVIPSYLEKSAKKENTFLIDENGNSLDQAYKIDNNVFEITKEYAKNSVHGFFEYKSYSPYFSYKTGQILERYMQDGRGFTLQDMTPICQFSFALADAYGGDDNTKYDFLYSLPSRYGKKELQWDLLLSDSDLEMFKTDMLLQFSLNSFTHKSSSLQDRVVQYLLSQKSKLDELLSQEAKILIADKYYARAEELSSKENNLISKKLLSHLFGNNPPPAQYINLRKDYLSSHLKESELPDDLTKIVSILDSIITESPRESSLLRDFSERILLRDRRFDSDLDFIKQNLSGINYNYFLAHLISDVGISDNDKLEILIKNISKNDISQTFLQNVLTKLVDNRNSTDKLKQKPFLTLTICNLVQNKQPIQENLQYIWDTTEKICKDNPVLEKELISNKWNELNQEYLFSKADANRTWIKKYPDEIQESQVFKQQLELSELIALVISSNSKGRLDEDTIKIFIHKVDQNLSLRKDLIENNLTLLHSRELWLLWRAKTKLEPTLLHELALTSVFSLSSSIKSFEVWKKLIDDCKNNQLQYKYLVTLEKENRLREISFLAQDFLEEEQFTDLLSLTSDYNVIDHLLKKVTPSINTTSKLKLLIDVKESSSSEKNKQLFSYINIFSLEEYKKFGLSKHVCVKGISNFIGSENPNLNSNAIKAFETVCNNNMNSEQNISETLILAKTFQLFDNDVFKASIAEVTNRKNESTNKEISEFIAKNNEIYYKLPHDALVSLNLIKQTTSLNQELNDPVFDDQTKELSKKLQKHIEIYSVLESLQELQPIEIVNSLNNLPFQYNDALVRQIESIKKVISGGCTIIKSEQIEALSKFEKESLKFLQKLALQPKQMSTMAKYISKTTPDKGFTPIFSKYAVKLIFSPLTTNNSTPPVFDTFYSTVIFNPQPSTVPFIELLCVLDTTMEEKAFNENFIKEISEKIPNNTGIYDKTLSDIGWKKAVENTLKKRKITSEYASNPAFDIGINFRGEQYASR